MINVSDLNNRMQRKEHFSSKTLEYLPPPQSPPFLIREFGNECKYELAEHGSEREAGAHGKEKSKAGASPFLPFPSFPADLLLPAAVSSEKLGTRGKRYRLSCQQRDDLVPMYP